MAERVIYSTHYGMRVPAIVYRPKIYQGKLPGIVLVNGHGGDKYSWYSFYSGILYARAGAVVITYDPIGEGERNVDRLSSLPRQPRVTYVSGPDNVVLAPQVGFETITLRLTARLSERRFRQRHCISYLQGVR